MHSLASTLALAEPFLSPALVGVPALERLRRAASRLPAALSRCIYLECRPTAPDRVDLIVDVDASGREILAGRNPAIELSAALRADPTWARVATYMRAWLDPNDRLAASVADAWLEFDLGGDDDLPPPSVFVDFAGVVFRDQSPERRFDALARAGHALDTSLTESAVAEVRRCIAALPPSAMLLYAGFMLARDTDAIRLCIMGLSPTELASYLRDIRWPGDVDAVHAMTTEFAQRESGGQSQPAIIHLDVGAAIGPNIGLEYPFARHSQLTGDLAEGTFLDALVAREFMTSDYRAALGEWPGHERRTLAHELWPSVVARRVNHVKLVSRDGTAFDAKFYLCAEHAPVGRK